MPMSSGPFGVKFAPTGEAAEDAERRGSAGQLRQDALQVFRLNVPRVVGAKAPAPAQLLTGSGARGVTPDRTVLHAILRALTGDPSISLPSEVTATLGPGGYVPPASSGGVDVTFGDPGHPEHINPRPAGGVARLHGPRGPFGDPFRRDPGRRGRDIEY